MTKNTRNGILLTAAVAVFFIAGMYMGNRSGRRLTRNEVSALVGSLSSSDDKLSTTLSLIRNEYVDSIAMDSIAEHVLPEIMAQLDPHSAYIPASELQEVDEPLQGEFDGIGVVFNMSTDTVIVLNVIPQGPSQKAGVVSGDRIMRVNDSLIAGRKLSTRDVMSRLRGKRGTKVRLGVERQGIKGLTEIEVTRDAIPVKSVEVAMMFPKKVGYIKLSQFSRNSFEEVHKALRELKHQGMQSLIFDLRGNSGGFLDQAILIANEFLPKGKLIVYTENRRHEQVRQHSNGSGTTTAIPLAVLIDEGSASSSEILAGALQDNDRCTIIGRRSFGKGLVQQQIPFADGSALRLTVARYYTPTGRSIQKPYVSGKSEDYELDVINRYNHNEFFSADSIRFADSLRYTTPKGKTVYGGGGIMPDKFIPLDTTDMTRYYFEVSGRNILYRYTLDYTDRHRTALNKVRTVQDMQSYFASAGDLVEDMVQYAAHKGIAPVRKDIAVSHKLMEAQIKAYIARNTELDNQGFSYFIAPVDTPLQYALHEADNPTVATTTATTKTNKTE